MQTNENHPNRKRIRNFFREKGYYIVLALCVCAVGVSGWLFVSNAVAEKKALRQETRSIATSAEAPAKNPSAEQKHPPTAAADEETAPAAAMTDDTVREAAKNVRVWPVSGSAQASYSVDALQYNATTQDWRTHAGVDLAASVGTPVKAAGSGVVTAVYDDEFLGTTVVVNHPDGHVSQYSNLAVMPSVSAGDSVEAGQTIGAVGETALLELADEPHLHFAVYANGDTIDPAEFIREQRPAPQRLLRRGSFFVGTAYSNTTPSALQTAAQRGHRSCSSGLSECIQQRGHFVPFASVTATVRPGKFTPWPVTAPSAGAVSFVLTLETMKISGRSTDWIASSAAFASSSPANSATCASRLLPMRLSARAVSRTPLTSERTRSAVSQTAISVSDSA